MESGLTSNNRPDGVSLIDYRLIVAFDDQLQTVASTTDTPTAATLRDFLADNGVLVAIRGEHHESFIAHYGARPVQLDILVPRWQRSAAEELLARFGWRSA